MSEVFIYGMIEMNNQGASNWKDWDGYMKSKVMKLDQQFIVGSDVKKTDIFAGISIFVNGYTDPDAEELKRLMKVHGGHYSLYYEKQRTTHIIATNLAFTKIKSLKDEKVVHPQWIVQSIAEGKLLPYENFELYPLAQRNGMQSLRNFKIEVLDDNSKTDNKTEDVFSKEVPDAKSTHTAQDPEFLETFFSCSRLHHISMLANKMKEYLASKKNSPKPLGDILARIQHLKRIDEFDVKENVFLHIDMDCFFASVALRNRPHLKDEPIAITHSKCVNKERRESYAEIASCNYIARSYGVSNGMLLGKALTLCPNLVRLPYEFDEYAETSRKLYDIVSGYPVEVEAVSCDEVMVDATGFLNDHNLDPESFVSHIRDEIKSSTQCPCSCGIGPNPLLARLATIVAKPDGQYLVKNAMLFLDNVKVSDLPGVGYTLADKLNNNLGIKTCKDLRTLNLQQLQAEFGKGTGCYLFNACRGIDTRKRTSSCRKSISVNVNYGIRLQTAADLKNFMEKLVIELTNRMKGANVKGQHLTLKVKIRAADAPKEAVKFLGHGECDDKCVSAPLSKYTDDVKDIECNAMKLFQSLQIDVSDLRGVALQVTKLKENFKDAEDVKSLDRFFNNANKQTSDGDLEVIDNGLIHLENRTEPMAQDFVETTINVCNANVEMKKNSIARTQQIKTSLDAFVIRTNNEPVRESVEDIIANADPNILQELPTQIRNEVVQEQNAVKQRRERQTEKLLKHLPKKPKTRGKKQMMSLKNRRHFKSDRCLGPDQLLEQSNLSEIPYEDVEELLHIWIENATISDMDMKLLRSYIDDLLDKELYASVNTIVRMLNRGIQQYEDRNFSSQRAFRKHLEELFEYARDKFQQRYGCVLDA